MPVIESVTIPSMLPPDQYPRDDRYKRRGDAMISIEVKEHELLRNLYIALYRFDMREAELPETVSAAIKSYDALNRFYSGESERKKPSGSHRGLKG